MLIIKMMNRKLKTNLIRRTKTQKTVIKIKVVARLLTQVTDRMGKKKMDLGKKRSKTKTMQTM